MLGTVGSYFISQNETSLTFVMPNGTAHSLPFNERLDIFKLEVSHAHTIKAVGLQDGILKSYLIANFTSVKQVAQSDVFESPIV
jgi:hypothetical protein